MCCGVSGSLLLQMSSFQPRFLTVPALRGGVSEERTEECSPASDPPNNQWLLLSGLRAFHSERSLRHYLTVSCTPLQRSEETKNPADSERIKPRGCENSCLIYKLLAAIY